MVYCAIVAKQHAQKMASIAVPAATARAQKATSRIPVPIRRRENAKDTVRTLLSRSGL